MYIVHKIRIICYKKEKYRGFCQQCFCNITHYYLKYLYIQNHYSKTTETIEFSLKKCQLKYFSLKTPVKIQSFHVQNAKQYVFSDPNSLAKRRSASQRLCAQQICLYTTHWSRGLVRFTCGA